MASLIAELTWLLTLTRSHLIARRYFVVNGFDGALTMLGLLVGFAVSDEVRLPVVINACLGVAIALGMSGISSAYISEAAEKRRELRELEKAMVTDLRQSAHAVVCARHQNHTHWKRRIYQRRQFGAHCRMALQL